MCRNKAHLHYSHFLCSLCSWSFCAFGQHHTHHCAPLSCALAHACVTISLLNSCLIIPNLREYSNKAFNAFFHMILRSRDSCSATFRAVFREGTDSSTHLIGEVWDSLQTYKSKKINYRAADKWMLWQKRLFILFSRSVAAQLEAHKEGAVHGEGCCHFRTATVSQFVWNAIRGDYKRVNFATQWYTFSERNWNVSDRRN